MMDDFTTRRAFLQAAGAAGATWLIADIALVREALAYAAATKETPPPWQFQNLTAEQAADIEAVAARIIPSDGTPGAKEAGVIHFIDRALSTFNASQKPVFDEGIADLNRRARERWRGTTSFASLTTERQDELLRSIESTPFFQAIRTATLFGMFALPSYGGNQNYVGWQLLGHIHQPSYQQPFGWYDDPANGGGR